jgi:bifunctional DNase/RNase
MRSLLVSVLGAAQACATTSPPPAARAPEVPPPPAGFVEMHVTRVSAQEAGYLVVLSDAAETLHLPIGVGGTEALSIHLRHERRAYERPLTHDLLDRVMERLGAHLVRVQVDGLKTGVFVGALVLTDHAGAPLAIDARPSDAIALALGSRVPILVAQAVLDQAGVHGSLEDVGAREERPADTY